MKVKFKKREIDVEQVNLVRRVSILFYIMMFVTLSLTFVCGISSVADASNVDSMEHENESSSEFEIKNVDFSIHPLTVAGMNASNMQLINYPVSIAITGSNVLLATTNVGITEYKKLDDEVEEIEEAEEIIVEEVGPGMNVRSVEETIEPFNNPEEIATETIVEETEVETEPIKEYYLNLSEHEKDILCRIVEAEVTGTGSSFGTSDEVVRTCKFRVARVIINRVLSPQFPNTVEGVVFQKNQFSPLIDGRYYKVSITDLTRQAVEMALDKSYPDDIPGALYFTSGRGFSSRKLSLIKTDEVGHKFYK